MASLCLVPLLTIAQSPEYSIAASGPKGSPENSGPAGDVLKRLNQAAGVPLPVTVTPDTIPVADTVRRHPQRHHHLEEVVVHDNHVELRRKEESLNVEVVNREFILRNLGGSLMKTLERLPGVKTIGIGSGQSKPLIRGLGFNRVVVIDQGVKHEGQQWGADHGLEIDQFAVGEAEVIKGAASFIYGSDAIGGAIEIKPSPIPARNTFGGSVDLMGKSNNNLLGTSLNLYSRKDKWFFDSRFTYQDYSDYRVPANQVFVYDYAVDLHDNYLRNTAGRETNLHFNSGYVNGKFRTVFYLSNAFSKSGFFADAHGLEPRRVDSDLHDSSSRDILLPRQQVNHLKLINRSSYSFQRHRVELELGYQRNYRQEHSQYVNHGYMPSSYPENLGIPADLEREFDKNVFSVNLRDKLSAGRHEFTFGVNSEYQRNEISGWTFLVPSFRQATAGVFVYDKVRLHDKAFLHGALRYDHGQLRMFEYTDWFPSTLSGSSEFLTRAEDLRRSFNSLVWSAGLNYNPGKFELKANIGKSFRMPIAKELSANGVNYHYFSYERGKPTLDAEQSYQADLSLGLKANKWSVAISPFFNYFPNYIYLNPTSTHDYYYGAGNQVFEYDESRVMRYGGELQLNYKLSGALSAGLLGEYLYSRQLSGRKKGYTLPFSPPASALVNLTWSPPSPNLTDTYFSIDYRVTGSQNRIVPPEKKTAGSQVFHIQSGTFLMMGKQALQVSFQVQNVLNSRYLNHTSFYRLINLPEAGRNFVLSVKLPFQINKPINNEP